MADVTSTFAAKDIGFTSTVNRMQASLSGFQGAITGFAAKAAILVGGFVAARSAVGAFQKAIDIGGQLNDLSARTGETAGNLLVLQRAFQNAGLGAEAVGGTINRLQRAIAEAASGSKEQAASFQQLGINFADLKNKTPLEQLQAVASALERVSNDSDRTKLAMALLGRSGGELIPLFKAMGIQLDEARGQLGSLPGLMDTMVPAFDKIGDNFNAIGEKGMEFAAGLLERLAPALVDITTKMANIDAAGFGSALSVYAEKTLEWINASLGLTTALGNIETAIKGIMSGNFGDSFKLMFFTARDTAFNAINQIVASGMAALATIGDSIRQLFSPGSVTMAFIEGAFTMLGAKIASSISGYLIPILESIPFMDAAAEAVRATKAEAEQAAKDIANIMYYEADNLKSEWAGILAEAPKAFADSYAANMKDPLIEMTERTKETAAQAEKVAAATRAAAFNAQEYANAMGKARENMLAGGDISPFGSPPSMGENDKDFKFPWQGSGPSGSQINIPEPAPDNKGGGGGSGRMATPKPKTAEDYETEMRAAATAGRFSERARSLQERGHFDAAGRAMEKADRAAQGVRDKANVKEFLRDQYDAGSMGEAYQKYRDMTGMDRDTREDFERKSKEKANGPDKSMRDQTKTPQERAREEKESGGGGGGGGSDPALSMLTEIKNFLSKTFFDDFKKRLPQNALS